MTRYLAVMVLALAPPACAQGLKLSVFDRLKDKATEVVDLNLPKNLIDIGVGFVPDADKLKKMALSSILIRSLEFDKEGVYSDADVQSLISELTGPGWNLVIKADEKKEKSRIWIKSSGNGELGGLRILSAEAKELSVIEIVGKVRPEDLKDLGGLLPDINLGSEHTAQPAKKNEE
jgi:hypothetical protein